MKGKERKRKGRNDGTVQPVYAESIVYVYLAGVRHAHAHIYTYQPSTFVAHAANSIHPRRNEIVMVVRDERHTHRLMVCMDFSTTV